MNSLIVIIFTCNSSSFVLPTTANPIQTTKNACRWQTAFVNPSKPLPIQCGSRQGRVLFTAEITPDESPVPRRSLGAMQTDDSTQIGPTDVLEVNVSPRICTNQSQDAKQMTLNKLQRRLDTSVDRLDSHKISSIAYVLSSLSILCVGAKSGYTAIPPSLEATNWIFVASSFFLSSNSIQMAIKYRRNDPIVQRGFINMALNMMSLGWVATWPFSPSWLSESLGNKVLLFTLLPILFLTTIELTTMKDCIYQRKKRRRDRGADGGFLGDATSYGLATVAGFSLSLLGTIILIDPSHDRAWLADAFSDGYCFVVYNYYSGVVMSLAVALSAFTITLSDRKIVTKRAEQIMVGIPAIVVASVILVAVSQLRAWGTASI